MVRQHHERWDGAGYPEGVGGGEIHLGARIISVVDTLDAMTTDRPYRPALPFEAAWDEIVECAGSQFDPGVVVALDDMGREHWRELVARELCSARTVL
jgi:HD-GYP domain-containing protein (c-di-GMP phosphodiesterase class II)